VTRTAPPLQSIYAIRRDNLRALIVARFGNVPARMAEALGFGQRSLIYSYLAARKPKQIGFIQARRMERVGRKPPHWLDQPHQKSR